MRRHAWIIVLVIGVGGGGLGAAAPGSPAGDDAVHEHPAAAAADPRKLDDPLHDAQVRYAEARLRLAELEWNIEQLTADVIDLRHRVEADAMADAGQRR